MSTLKVRQNNVAQDLCSAVAAEVVKLNNLKDKHAALGHSGFGIGAGRGIKIIYKFNASAVSSPQGVTPRLPELNLTCKYQDPVTTNSAVFEALYQQCSAENLWVEANIEAADSWASSWIEPSSTPLETLREAISLARATFSGRSDKAHTVPDKIDLAAKSFEDAITKVVDQRLVRWASPEEVRFSVPESYVPGYEAAVAAGAKARIDILKRTDMLSSKDVAVRLGVSQNTVNQRRRNRGLLALKNEVSGFKYPDWQIDPGVRETIADVLAELGEKIDSWATYLFFTQGNPLLCDLTPVEALKKGRTAEVLRAAASLREELA
jgi:hypothetical protein